MDEANVRYKESEYCAIFSIPADIWNSCKYDSQDTTLDIAHLSEEPFIDYMYDYIVEAVVNDPELKERVDSIIAYSLGLVISK